MCVTLDEEVLGARIADCAMLSPASTSVMCVTVEMIEDSGFPGIPC